MALWPVQHRLTLAPLADHAAGPRRDERGKVLVGIPTALRSVGEHEQFDVRAATRPMRERRATPELDVVGMRTDGEDARRNRRGHG